MDTPPEFYLRVEREKLPALREAFEKAAAEVDVQLIRLQLDGRIPEPWLGDEVSAAVARYYNEHVMGATGTAYAAIRKYRDELVKICNELEKTERRYAESENENADRWVRLTWSVEQPRVD